MTEPLAATGRGGAAASAPADSGLDRVEVALELEQLDVDLFRSCRLWKPHSRARAVFGGQIIGQSLAAADRTVEDKSMKVHSLHSYFVRPGDNTAPALYYVRRVRDGASFATRQVTARQRGRPIFEALVSFHRDEEGGLSYQEPMPDVPAPTTLLSRNQNWQSLLNNHRDEMPERMVQFLEVRLQAPFPLDMRNCDQSIDIDAARMHRRPRHPKQHVWVRAAQQLEDSSGVHACVAAFASDYMLVSTAALPASTMFSMAASLDHSMWFHGPFRADSWMLYELTSSRARGGRALTIGRIFRADGTLAITTSQECLLRYDEPQPPLPEKQAISKL